MFIQKNLSKLNYKNIFIIFLVILGFITSVSRGYGDDIDSFALILTFINFFENGTYTPSRYYGYPFAELFYGSSGYFLGSFYSTLFSYIFFITSLFVLSKIYLKDTDDKNKILFILICLTNPVVFFDNTNPSDAPLSLFLFSIGLFYFNKKNYILSAIFFGLTVATRSNFALFIIFIYLYQIYKIKKLNINLIKNFIIFFTICFIFYLPILHKNNFNLSFITNPGGPDLDFISLFPRFIYKIYLSIGVFSSIIILIFLVFKYKKIYLFVKKNFFLLCLILLNFMTFFFMPTKTSIISLAIILIYIYLLNIFEDKKIVYFLIMFNFTSYFISYQFLDIEYKYKNKCAPIEAIGAKIELKLKDGYYFERTKKIANKIKCDAVYFNERSTNYLKGGSLK